MKLRTYPNRYGIVSHIKCADIYDEYEPKIARVVDFKRTVSLNVRQPSFECFSDLK